ncbi:ABC transporter substrate-binding protein [Conexibacter stalactiti]|uniref:ABC transporter substrate-binding protein n=1 Tax=Conexibacter stalactiti TaxID=1940611 RepID=A0ABU4HTF2_9ACTN|nr:ABC transporter substrate-binding protein [Conexibacter stalactiti]MDW5595339.1 ABC transporter substrate-binding protein [Conexibacter stalactiti]MEC5035981.1 ABC transporter substrate-binding protein [Conexibacter stalactiti]
MRTRKRARIALVALLTALVALVVAGCGSSGDDDDGGGGSGDGPVEITFWHGQNQTAEKALKSLVARFNESHPDIVVKAETGALSDSLYQKTTAALAGGKYPDIVYQFGPNVASLARSPKALDLTEAVRDPSWRWDEFYPAAQEATMVDGKVRAVPALIDSMAVVYNRRLFREAGVAEPRAGWTWDDYRATARQLTDSGKGQFGTGWPGVGDEDTVWRLWPMVWQLGGDVTAEDNTKAGFSGEPGLRAFTTINEMAVTDRSVYIDKTAGSEKMIGIFNSNRMAMIPTGPWQLPETIEAGIDYGVVPLPSFSDRPTTISGPDTWMLFDNGEARARAVTEFAKWLTLPEQDAEWDVGAGSLPLRTTTAAQPVWRRHSAEVEGLDVFVAALEDARVRPTIVAYPRLSEATGTGIVEVLLGSADPQAALDKAVEGADEALAGD